MTRIVIKDLPENLDLDRQAMAAIAGGARFGGGQPFLGRTILRTTRIIDYPGGFTGNPPADAHGRSAQNTPINAKQHK